MKRMLMRKPLSKMAGITLLETMFAIAVGALILIAAAIFFTTSKQSQNVSKVVADINTIVAQTSSYIAPGGDSITNINGEDHNSVATLQAAGYLPADMTTPWGGAYSGTVTKGGRISTGVVATTDITVGGFGSNDSTCKAIAQAVSGSGSKGGRLSSGGTCTFTFDL